MSLTCTNTGNCHSVHVPVITCLPLVKATESVLPTLLLIRDTIACHGIWVNLHRHHHWRQQPDDAWSASEHAKHGPASFTILILTLAANTATRIPAYIAAHFLWRTNIAGTYNPFNRQLAKLLSGNEVRGKVAIAAMQKAVNFTRSLSTWFRKVSWAPFHPNSETF